MNSSPRALWLPLISGVFMLFIASGVIVSIQAINASATEVNELTIQTVTSTPVWANVPSEKSQLRDHGDVQISSQAPFWTTQRLLSVMPLAVATAIVLSLWTWALQRHLKKQAFAAAELRAQEVGHDAVIEERNRLASDLHDGVQQLISGVSMHIETARNGLPPELEESNSSLSIARRLIVRLRDEVRSCVWALHEVDSGQSDLIQGLEKLVTTQKLCGESEIELSVEGDQPIELSSSIISSLLLVANEAITNAVRHGHASNIRLTVNRQPKVLKIAIADNGKGFDPLVAAGEISGCFGLVSMRHRMARLGGSLQVVGAPGQGARVISILPLESPHTKPTVGAMAGLPPTDQLSING